MLVILSLLVACVQAVLRPRRDLVLENLLLRYQLAVLSRLLAPVQVPASAPGTGSCGLWHADLCADWRHYLVLVTPDTVVRWHRQGWRLFWRWKSRSPGGCPHLSPQVRDLITTMSRDNRLWATERIRGEPLKLGIEVSIRSIRRYR